MWREIRGYEGVYEISDSGVLRRMNGVDSDGRKISGHSITASKAANGKRYIVLWKDGQRKTYMLHKVYADTFHVTETEACRRLYQGFSGNTQAVRNVKEILQNVLAFLEREHNAGKDRHDEMLYIRQFLGEMEDAAVQRKQK